ncbi:hypothetical protein DFQ27_007403 [Actinomortierella ambigua]|uniref:Ubiquitin 3 binding protein But2 C-terminal domain-containing protein n=1 Tax=Actinomortierella ambigua TaxID=1343610 RepID=A0A9P6QKX0_9FUNG|nr:hypothetical protein DFQ27_007403 [Actinomortierella ambigua]
MKLFAPTLLAACVPSACLAVVYNEWAFVVPPTGLSDISFPFNVANAPHRRGFYFAQQFNFQNISSVCYTGLQPQVDDNGKSVIRGVFSSFQDGTTTSHPNCSPGADGGPGVSCGLIFPADYSHTFNMVVENTGGTTWRGSAVDTVTNVATEIGVWTLPSEAGGILGSQGGFIEYFLWNDGRSHDCSTLPFTEVTIFNPTSKTTGASGGTITSVYEQPGDCVTMVNFSDTLVPGGHDIKVGFS